MQDTKELQSFDVFSRKTGSWKFLCSIDAYTPTQAKEKAMREHQLTNWTGVSVYPTK